MSVHKRPNGRFEVKWREAGRGSTPRSRTFARFRDAEAFDLDVKRRKQLGSLAPSVVQCRMTLAEFVETDYWPRYAIPNLAEDTRRRYLEVWGTHLLPRVGGHELRAITPMVVEDLREQLTRAGVGAATVRKALMLLQGILSRAVVRELISINPVQVVPKPKQAPTQVPRPLPPETVEAIRAHMLTMWTSPRRGTGRSPTELQWWRQRNATIVSLLAYGGVRPIEDRTACWERRMCARPYACMPPRPGGSGTSTCWSQLAQDLAEWRLLCGRPPGKSLIVPSADGDEWRRHDWQNWRRRVWRPAALAVGVTGDLRPYRLRGSFVSLLLWEGRSLTYVAEQAGHGLATLARHYAGVIAELEGEPRIPAAEAIRKARERVACSTGVRRQNKRAN